MKKFSMIFMLMTFTMVGCQDEGPAEEFGREVDEAAREAGNAIEDACEEIRDQVDAEDIDC